MKYFGADVNCAAVCGNQGLIFSPLIEQTNTRNLLQVLQFSNYGQAKLWADEYDDKQRARAR